MSDLNDEIRAAIDTSDVDRARALLREALNNTPDADIYYLASLVALSDDQKQRFLKKATELDPFHSEAHAALGATAQNIPAQPVAPAPQETAPAPPSAHQETAPDPPSAQQETAPATTAPSSEPPGETAETTTANASQTVTSDTAQPEKPAGTHWGRAIVIGLLLLAPTSIPLMLGSHDSPYTDTLISLGIAFWLAGVLWAGRYGRRSWEWLAVCMSPTIIPLLALVSIPGRDQLPPEGMLVLAVVIIGIPLVGAVFPAFLLTLVWRDQPSSQRQPTPANN
jgi:hypothetical protein